MYQKIRTLWLDMEISLGQQTKCIVGASCMSDQERVVHDSCVGPGMFWHYLHISRLLQYCINVQQIIDAP